MVYAHRGMRGIFHCFQGVEGKKAVFFVGKPTAFLCVFFFLIKNASIFSEKILEVAEGPYILKVKIGCNTNKKFKKRKLQINSDAAFETRSASQIGFASFGFFPFMDSHTFSVRAVETVQKQL
jgi:hypothetical protein